ncbi:selenium cofactor biosynthesis protein YqeC [Breznakiellaceae bacterium SP9]
MEDIIPTIQEDYSGSLSGWLANKLERLAPAAFPPVLTAIGTGGKTSLIWLLAEKLSRERFQKILVSPTTNMQLPPPASGLYAASYIGPPTELINGVSIAGIPHKETDILTSLPLDELEQAARQYDLVLIKGDGSRSHPLKGWAPHEPVVPAFTTITVGVLPVWTLGHPVSDSIVHRLPLFCALSGAQEGEDITTEHLARVITGTIAEKGLFADARGRKILFFNQIENDKTLKNVRKVLALLPYRFKTSLAACIAGSVQQDCITIV